MVFADNTGFDKIVIGDGACATFAGNSRLISVWKDWIRNPAKHVVPRPAVVEDFSMCVVNEVNGALIFEHGQKIVDVTYRFAGTGAWFAHSCWIKHKNAVRSVETATKDDAYSGGQVKFLDARSAKHNVDPGGAFEVINEAITTRGVVMYKAYDGKEVPIAEAAITDPSIRTLLKNISTGDASAEAPSGRDPVVWTETDVQRLDTALEGFFGSIAKR